MEAKLQEEDGVYMAAGALGVSKHGGVCVRAVVAKFWRSATNVDA